jgi:flagellar hook assembly protein FlgD
VSYAVSNGGLPVRLSVFNVRGQMVRTLVSGVKPAGTHEAYWDGKDGGGRVVASGIYYCVLKVGDFSGQEAMVLLR